MAGGQAHNEALQRYAARLQAGAGAGADGSQASGDPAYLLLALDSTWTYAREMFWVGGRRWQLGLVGCIPAL